MKTPLLLALLSFGSLAILPLEAADPAISESVQAPLTAEQIDELLAPIALYPDPLVAIILPASTFPADLVMAARYLDAKRSPDAIEDQPWDDSVKALARYPDVIDWMDENLEWTRQLGEAFTLQPAAVLTGTQRLRAAAIAAGNLKTTTEQTVIVEKEIVRIVPAQREVIYVPVYDPYWAYRPWPAYTYSSPRPVTTFSIGYSTGFWLSYHFNWGVNSIVIVNRPYRAIAWQTYPGWGYPTQTVVHYHHVWRPEPIYVTNVRRDYERRREVHIVQPTVNVYVQRNKDRTVNRTVNVTPGSRRDSAERPERPDRPGRTDRITRPEHTDRTTRPERAERPARIVPTRAPAVSATPPPTRERPDRLTTEGTPSPERKERRERNLTGERTDPTTPGARPALSRPAPRLTRDADAPSRQTVGAPPPTSPRFRTTPASAPDSTRTPRPAPSTQRPERPERKERQATTPRPTRTQPPAPATPSSVAPRTERTNRTEPQRLTPRAQSPAPTARPERMDRPTPEQRIRPAIGQPAPGTEDPSEPRGSNRGR